MRFSSVINGISSDLLLTLSMNHDSGEVITSNPALVDSLKKRGAIRSTAVEIALRLVDRADFVREDGVAYEDKPQKIGCKATISSPHMHAIALEALAPQLRPGMQVLDVGSGSGYLTACMALMVVGESNGRGTGTALGIDHCEALVRNSIVNACKSHDHLVQRGALRFSVGNPLDPKNSGEVDKTTSKNGDTDTPSWLVRLLAEAQVPVSLATASFDCIHVGAAVRTIPQLLLTLLKPGGLLLIPVAKGGAAFAYATSAFGDSGLAAASYNDQQDETLIGEQDLLLVKKNAAGQISQESLMTCIYSPMTVRPPAEALPDLSPAEQHNLLTQSKADLETCSAHLKLWQGAFKDAHGRRPSASDMTQDPQVAELLSTFRAHTKTIKILEAKLAKT
jgi:protein-L-isoaspartate(D-aspartate) O-methyltransferase